MRWIFCWCARFVAWCVWKLCPRIAIELLYETCQVVALRRLQHKMHAYVQFSEEVYNMLTDQESRSFWAWIIMIARITRGNEVSPDRLINVLMQCPDLGTPHIRGIVRTAIAGERWLEYTEPGPIDPSSNDWEHVVGYLMSSTATCVTNDTIIAVAEEAGIELTFESFKPRTERLLQCLRMDPNNKGFYLSQAVDSAAFGDEIDPVRVGHCLEAGIAEGLISLVCGLAASHGVPVSKSSLASAVEFLIERGLINEALVAVRESDAVMRSSLLREWSVYHAQKGNATASMQLVLAAEACAVQESISAS